MCFAVFVLICVSLYLLYRDRVHIGDINTLADRNFRLTQRVEYLERCAPENQSPDVRWAVDPGPPRMCGGSDK